MLALNGEPIVDLGLLYANAQQFANQRLERRAKVLQMVCVEQRIDGRIQVRQYDGEQRQYLGDVAVRIEGLDAIDGVQRQPADHEEQHDDGEVLRGLDLAFARGAQHAEHGAALGARDRHEVELVFGGAAAAAARVFAVARRIEGDGFADLYTNI